MKLNLVKILPKVLDLCISSTDEIKITSCELLHSIIIFMVFLFDFLSLDWKFSIKIEINYNKA